MGDISDCQTAWPAVARTFAAQRATVAGIPVARPIARAATARIEYLDVARGLFVAWMVTAHALTLAGVPPTHPLQLLRPAGWSTACFVMLSGFGIATVFGRAPLDVTRAKLRRRGVQLLAIAFLSNLASMVVTAALGGSLTTPYVVRVVTFQVPWSISGVLVPTGLVALAAPSLLGLQRRFRPLTLLVMLAALNVACDLAVVHSPAVRAAFGGILGVFSFPVISLCLYSAAALSLSLVASTLRPPTSIVYGALTAAGALIAVLLLAWYPTCLLQITSLLSVARFAVGLSIAITIAHLHAFARIRPALVAAGRSALLIFILHRPLLQALMALLGDRLPPTAAAVTLITFGWSACVGLGVYRLRETRVSAALHRVGL